MIIFQWNSDTQWIVKFWNTIDPGDFPQLLNSLRGIIDKCTHIINTNIDRQQRVNQILSDNLPWYSSHIDILVHTTIFVPYFYRPIICKLGGYTMRLRRCGGDIIKFPPDKRDMLWFMDRDWYPITGNFCFWNIWVHILSDIRVLRKKILIS